MDIERLAREIDLPLNMEMAATEEMRDIALQHQPNACCLVPESREEVTTEGGLNVLGEAGNIGKIIAPLKAQGIRISLFIDPDPEQIGASAALGADIVELHTGTYCHAHADGDGGAQDEIERLQSAAILATQAGMRCMPATGCFRTVGGCGYASDCRTEYRAFSHRRVGFLRPAGSHCRNAPLHAGRARSNGRAFMILGIGNDLIDIRRIEKTLERYGDRFVQRIFTSTSRPPGSAASARGVLCQALCARKRAPKRLAQACDRGFLARYGRQQFAVRKADHAPDQWRAKSA